VYRGSKGKVGELRVDIRDFRCMCMCIGMCIGRYVGMQIDACLLGIWSVLCYFMNGGGVEGDCKLGIHRWLPAGYTRVLGRLGAEEKDREGKDREGKRRGLVLDQIL